MYLELDSVFPQLLRVYRFHPVFLLSITTKWVHYFKPVSKHFKQFAELHASQVFLNLLKNIFLLITKASRKLTSLFS